MLLIQNKYLKDVDIGFIYYKELKKLIIKVEQLTKLYRAKINKISKIYKIYLNN